MARGSGISLIGYRASGKSTVARHIAAMMGRQCIDVDQEIERRTGQTIASIFHDQGEASFREIEQDVLRDLSREQSRAVLATGGGVVLRPANHECLRQFGRVFWLHAPVGTLVERLRASPGDRPSLTGAGLLDEVESVLAAREPLYRELADHVVDTSVGDPREIARLVVDLMNPQEAGR